MNQPTLTTFENLSVPETIQPKLTRGERLRDRGTHIVLEHNPSFKQAVQIAMDSLCAKGRPFNNETLQGEMLRLYPGLQPTHVNAWGAAFQAAMRMGKIRHTGHYTKAVKPASHARRIPFWEPISKAA